jgi:hypothetical protein
MNAPSTDSAPVYSRQGVFRGVAKQTTPARAENKEALPLPPGPYPGLRPYSKDESRLFCGRALERLRLLRMLASSNFLAVLGSSGSGKSSLVLSGLIPDIQSGRMPDSSGKKFQIAIFRPGRNPFGNLADALQKTWLGKGFPDPFFIEDRLRSSHLALSRLIAGESASPEAAGESLIIVVDQFEEIFRFANLTAQGLGEQEDVRRDFRTLAGDLNEAQAFITLLLTTARESAGRVRIITTMRSDFFKHCEVFDGLPEAIAACQFITPRMSREQMEDAVQQPLAHFGCTIQDELVNVILNEVHDEFDQLPVLQHALARMWHMAKAARPPQPDELTTGDYSAAQRLSGALQAHGEQLIGSGKLDALHVARFFRCLGDFDPTSGHAIRRPRTLAQVQAESGLSEETCRAITAVFAAPEASFLALTPADEPLGYETIIDLTHECLLRKWTDYVGWMNTERTEGRGLLKVTEQMTTGDHLTPGMLHRWLDALPDLEIRPPGWGNRYQCDLKAIWTFLDTEKKSLGRQQRNRWIKIGGFYLAVLVAILAFAWQRKEAAEAKAAAAVANEQVAEAKASAEVANRQAAEKTRDAALLKEQQAQAQAELSAQMKTRSDNQSQAQKQILTQVGDLESQKAKLSEVISRLRPLATTATGTIPDDLAKQLLELGFGPQRGPASVEQPPQMHSLEEFGPIQSLGVLGTEGGVRLLIGGEAFWTTTPSLEHPKKVWNEKATSITLSTAKDSAGWYLVTNSGPSIGVGRGDGTPWQQINTRNETKQAGVTRARLIPGQRIVLGTANGKIGLLDAASGTSKPAVMFDSQHTGIINDIFPDPSGKWLLASGDDYFSTLWQVQDGLSLKFKDSVKSGAPVRSARFSPDGRWALLPSGEREIALYLMPKEELSFLMDHRFTLSHDQPVVSGGFSSDGRWIATADTKGKICIWHAVPGDFPVGVFNHSARISAMAWAPNSQWLAAADRDGNAIAWRIEVGETVTGVPEILPKSDKTIDALAWSPQSDFLAIGDLGGSVHVHPLVGKSARVTTNEVPPTTRQQAAKFILQSMGPEERFSKTQEPTPEKWQQALVGSSLQRVSKTLSLLVAEGLPQHAERVAIDNIMSKTDNDWLGDSSPDALDVFIRCIIWSRGRTEAAQIIQQVLGVKYVDGVFGDETRQALQKTVEIIGRRSLLNRLHTAASKDDPGSFPSSQQALDFANTFLPQDAEDVDRMQRARSAIGKDTRFELSKGGKDPIALHPAENGACDCSGFIAWVLGLSRQTTNPYYLNKMGGWMDVSTMQEDMKETGGFLSPCDPHPGCLVAYGSGRDSNRNIAIVTVVESIGGKAIPTRVISCTRENWAKANDSIQETAADRFVQDPTTVYGRLDMPPAP